ncbi:MAG TPA: hypothetical protein VD929_02025, partial [Caulobacteraceae bacterium]|nr:hypothetical protein [Caulobacteraceae bacterium]
MTAETHAPQTRSWFRDLRLRLRALYHGRTRAAVRFRYGVIVVDLLVIAFFIAAPLLREQGFVFYALDFAAAVVLSLD